MSGMSATGGGVPRWLVGAVAGLAAAISPGIIWLRVEAQTGPWYEIGSITGGAIAFVVVGLVAHQRRPGNTTGFLMVVLGLGILLESVRFAEGPPWLHLAGQMMWNASNAPLALLVLSFPTGIVVGRQRWAIIVVAGCSTLAAMVLAIAALPDPLLPTGLPLWPSQAAYDSALAGMNVVISVIVVWALVLLGRGWWVAPPHRRRAITPMLLVTLVGGLTAATAPVPDRSTSLGEFLHLTFAACTLLWPAAFLYGVVRVEMVRTPVARLLGELTSAHDLPTLQAGMARALGDPSLVLAVASRAGFVDAAGLPVVWNAPDPGRHASLLERRGRPYGVAVHDAALLEQRQTLESVLAAAAVALENTHLAEEARSNEARLAEQVAAAREQMERDLHDGAQGYLVAASVNLQSALQRVVDDPATTQLLESAATALQLAHADVRLISHGLFASFGPGGLGPALTDLAERAPLRVALTLDGLDELPGSVSTTAYFVVAEALTNVVKHAGTDQAWVEVAVREGNLHVVVIDQGRGLVGAPGRGFEGLRHRVAGARGTLEIDSGKNGGVRVGAAIPLAT